MNSKLVIGLIFQIMQFVMLAIVALYYLIDNVTITKSEYIAVFGGIVLVAANVFSLMLISAGLRE